MDGAYEITQDPITNAQYCVWLRSLPDAERALHYCRLMELHFFGGITSECLPKPGFANKPVVFVSWYDAKAFAESLGCRLPTVAEWRKAAAWSPKLCRHFVYCHGSDERPTQRDVNYYDFETGWALPAPHLADVDWYRPSGSFGLRGMAGNVAEWCADESRHWQPALGGSVFRPSEFCRVDAGEADVPTRRLSTFGFRIVRDVAQ